MTQNNNGPRRLTLPALLLLLLAAATLHLLRGAEAFAFVPRPATRPLPPRAVAGAPGRPRPTAAATVTMMAAAGKSACGLTLEQVASKLKFEVTDLDEGIYGLDSKDANYAIEIVKVNVPLKPGLGLSLEELKRGRDGRGCVLVSALQPGGNAEKSGKVQVGDMICYLGKEPKGMVRVEGFDFDGTMAPLQAYASTGASAVTLVLKRLVKRATMKVTFTFQPTPEEEAAGQKPWNKEVTMLTGSNLRKEMLRQNIPVYDRKTKRFDQPYAVGDCAGEGLCGTCLVQVLEGKEFLNKPDGVEAMVLKKWNAANWRLGCRCIVGAVNEPGVVRFKCTPQKPFNK